MDENDFQRELVQLKTRVSQLVASFNRAAPTLPPPASSSDAFLDHLQDVKDRLQTMQDSLNQTNARHKCTSNTGYNPNAAMPTDSAIHVPHNSLFLPSGPLFWQLFTSLRTDVRSLHTRFADLEQNISDLEDRVDRIDPAQITPAGSDASHLQWERNCVQPSANFGFDWQPSILENDSNTWHPGHIQRPSELDTTFAGSNDLYGIQACDMLPESNNSVGHPRSAPIEGVAFRDREIAQLEDLMREKDIELARQHAKGVSYDAKINELETRLAEKESAVATYSDMLSQAHSDVEGFRASYQEKETELTDWITKHDRVRQSCTQKRNQLMHADYQIQHIQRSMYDLQQRKQVEIEDIIARKDDEMRKMKDFCDSKDAVVYQQEEIISRGATLLQERDEEIGMLSRQLQVTKDDLENEQREKERFSRLFDERGEVISQLRTALNQALTPRPIRGKCEGHNNAPETGSQRSRNSETLYSPFATTGLEAHTPRSQKWTPKAMLGLPKLPHEEKRAASWEMGRSADARTFGRPSPLGCTSRKGDDAAELHKKDLRRSDSLKLLRRLALVEECTPSKSSSDSQPSSSKRHRLPLEDLSSRPPLPAPLPLPPRRLSSVADLSRSAESHKPASKHPSMQQAYVEEGEESIGES
ncbi:hypothetical protein AC578_444 [Pseudocercospora eumusae]|uniref:Uncharacterized protein n=1 Tax=Pseudocercospora eumusae TaxID=321146 RepID=A0A139HXZ1_9PEZI|nr:hypothetical protein AC578_444 [Pseudocercospora eumusae]